MLEHPETQKRAHEELDRIVGRHSLPTLEDREHLPYIKGLIKEIMRFYPVAPIGKEKLCTHLYVILILSRYRSSAEACRIGHV